MSGQVKVFVSHLRADESADVARVLSAHFEKWNIPRDNIFTSAIPKQGTTPGENLTAQLKERLSDVNLFVLVYTYADRDWSFCTLEYGVVTGNDTVPTRTIVFECADHHPRWFDGEVRVPIEKSNIENFVTKFHTDKDFVPGLVDGKGEKIAFHASATDDLLNARAEELYSDLRKAIPHGSQGSQHRWDFLRLRLANEHLEALKSKNPNNEDHRADAHRLIMQNMEVLRPEVTGPGGGDDGRTDAALRQFGYHTYSDGLRLINLEDNWRKLDGTGDDSWMSDLHQALFEAANNSDVRSVKSFFKSPREDTSWYFIPAVTRVRSMPKSKEFDVYLVRVSGALLSIDPPARARGQARSTSKRPASRAK